MVINQKVESGVVSVLSHTTIGNLKLAGGSNKYCVHQNTVQVKTLEIRKYVVGCVD